MVYEDFLPLLCIDTHSNYNKIDESGITVMVSWKDFILEGSQIFF